MMLKTDQQAGDGFQGITDSNWKLTTIFKKALATTALATTQNMIFCTW